MRTLVVGILRIYKRWISPSLPSACRFHPTCSEYMLQAVEKHGVVRGVWLGMMRLLRCHPFGNSGLDFVPDAKPARARWYLPWRYGRWRGTNSAMPPSV